MRSLANRIRAGSAPARRSAGVRSVFCCVALCTLSAVAPAQQIITFSSGGGTGGPGTPDPLVTYYTSPGLSCGFALPFPATFPTTGLPAATIVSAYPGWLDPGDPNAFPCDPNARWIALGAPPTSRSALYVVPFTIDDPCPAEVALDFCFAADDQLGDGLAGPNPDGLYVNGTGLTGTTGGTFSTVTQWTGLNITSLVHPGVNYLYIYVRDVGCSAAGLIFHGEIQVYSQSNVVCGAKYLDGDCDGERDPGEPGLGGWTIVLTNDATGEVITTTTFSDGTYCFQNVPYGTYSLCEEQQSGGPGWIWTQTQPDCECYTITVDCDNLNHQGYDFGNCQCDVVDLNENLATGFDQVANNPIPIGSFDDDWRLTGVPAGSGIPLGPAFIVAPNIAWATPQTGSRWISATANGSNYTLPHGFFTFERCFYLCPGYSNPQLSMSIFVDDSADILLNGVLIGAVSGFAPSSGPNPVATADPDLFHPGWNCITVEVFNLPLSLTPTGFDATGTVTATAGVCCEHRCPCAEPPHSMVGWWPLDEAVAGSARDIAGFPNTGTDVNGPASAAGAVGLARQFNGVNQRITVADHPTLDFGTAASGRGDFTVDAWIQTTSQATQGIVSKWDASGFGFELDLGAGALTALIAESASSWGGYSTPVATLADGQWHHVAVAVGHAGTPAARWMTLYVDGMAYPRPAAPPLPTGALANSAPLEIGRKHAFGDAYFDGRIDEVEIFNRALTAAEIFELYRARSEGKCRESCYVPSVNIYCSWGTTVDVGLQVCNYTDSPQSYTVGPVVSTWPGCGSTSLAGSSISFPNGSTVTVPARWCTVVPIRFTKPSGMTAAGDSACYSVTVTNTASGEQLVCDGRLVDRRDICPSVSAGGGGGTGLSGIVPLPTGVSVPVEFELTDTDAPDGTILYRLEVIAHDGITPSHAVSLDDFPPGEPIEGLVDLPSPGSGSATIMVDVLLESDSAFDIYDLLLSTDVDGDGEFEPLYALGLATPGYQEFTPNIAVPWSDDLDAYDTNSDLHGQAGWQGWDGNPAAGALVSDAQASSAPNSAAIVADSDLVHRFAGANDGRWELTTWLYVPGDFQSNCDSSNHCGSYLLVLNTYQDSGPYHWSVQLHADSISNAFIRDGDTPASLPLVYDSWTEVRVQIDLDYDTYRVFYNGAELGSVEPWAAGVYNNGGGVLEIAALDLYANGSSVVYYDDFGLVPYEPPFCPDLDGDGVIDLSDLAQLLAHYGQTGASFFDGDLDGDFDVDLADLAALLADYGEACP